ncbi:MAG: amidohydrolase family protein [Pyrinomonadaceae bacterium MAG19_C2-C3]|nr:amidohydrolase family protein [Pyrinomonadaceae bacterium MAG19_C2-C3]
MLESEAYAQQVKRNDTVGDRGLDPALVPSIVAKAHAAGLRVSAHVDTITDYRVALRAGVDEMAHLPGYYFGEKDDRRKYELTIEDAKETARRGVWVVPCPIVYERADAKTLARIDELRTRNLTLLKKHRVNIALGSDNYGSTPLNTVLYLNKTGAFSNLETLKMWCEATPQTIFPKRKIGFLRKGYEASFLVLDGNPVKDFAQINNIRLRFKQGRFLTSVEKKP